MSWKEYTLGEIAEIDWGNTNLTKEAFEENGTYLGVSAAGIDGLMNHFEHEPGVLVLSAIGANCGKLFYPTKKFTAIKNTITIKSDLEKADPRYLFYFLNYSSFRRRGAGQPFITKGDVQSKQLKLPHLDYQKKAASILDKADDLRRKDQQLLVKYDELLQSIFYQMFGDPVKNERGWQTVRLRDVVQTRLGKMLDAKKISGQHLFKYLGNSNVLWNSFDLKNLKEMDFLPEERKEFDLRKSDILMCEGGEVGRCAIWKEEGSNIFFQKALHRIRVNKKMLNEHYFVWLMFNYSKNSGFKDYVSSVTISHLTGVKLKSMIIPLPPIQLQNEFAGTIALLEHQMTLCKLSVDKSESLFQSLLRKAFKGELVK